MADTLKWLEGSLQAALGEVNAIADQVNRITTIVRTHDLLIEMDIEPGDPETDKRNLIRLRDDEVAGLVDWGEGPTTNG